MKLLMLLLSIIVFSNINIMANINDQMKTKINLLINQKDSINNERKEVLEEMSSYIVDELKKDGKINLTFICTHNSRRSHISQLWAIAAADYFGIPNVNCYSGGTEVSAFNPRSVKALQKVGFIINKLDNNKNTKYSCKLDEDSKEIISFSKKFDDKANPQDNFVAVMVCSHADAHCPFIMGAKERFSLNYDDPKEFDNTPQEEVQYDYTVQLIGREIFYLFARVKEKLK